MPVTYLEHLKIRVPDIGEQSWGDECNDNFEIVDFMAGGGKAGNRVIEGCEPSDGGGLDVDVAAGRAVVNGVFYDIAAVSKTCTANTKNWLCIDADGDVQVYTTAPTLAYATLAMIDAGASSIDRIADCRQLPSGVAADAMQRPRRNRLINGNFDFWQRGTSLAVTSGAGEYIADRWAVQNGLATSYVCSRQVFSYGQTNVPGNPAYYCRHVVTTSNAAGEFCAMGQRIEYATTLSGETITLSFWAKSDSNKSIGLDFVQNFGSGGDAAVLFGAQTIALTTSWQKFTVTVTVPSVSGKTIAAGNFISPRFWFSTGSNYATLEHYVGNQSGTFDIAQVQLEPGPFATDFEYRSIGEELALCRRYYETSAPFGIPVASVAAYVDQYEIGDNIGGGYYCVTIFYNSVKRQTPTLYLYDAAGTKNKISFKQSGSFVHGQTVPGGSVHNNKFILWAVLSGYSGLAFNWEVDAEL
jgi:hypothetical protein